MTSPDTPKTRGWWHALSLLNPSGVWKGEFAGYNAQRFAQDALAGVTVGVVALPLALAFGVTSGAGAAAGLFTAIVAGLVASVFGGSRYQISGPTGAMTVVLLPIIAQYGLEKVFVAGLMAGVMLVLMGLLRLGRLVQFIPWPVITGFTGGIAVIIFLQQVPALLGLGAARGEGIVPVTLETVRLFLVQPQYWTLALTALTAVIMVLWTRVSKRIPGSMVALLLVTGLSLLFKLEVPRIGAIPTLLPAPSWPSVTLQDLSLLFSPALAIALLAGIESLLSAVVADGMTTQERHDPNRELVGQGLANLLVPLFGGIPATGAIARTAVNLRSGGQTRVSGVIHSLFLVVVVLLLGRYAALIPTAALAGILMVTAVRMVELEAIRGVFRSTKSDFSALLLTTFVTIAFDLVLAIEVGLAVAAVLFIRRMAGQLELEPMDLPEHTPTHLNVHQQVLGERVVAFRVEGPLFFGVAGEFIDVLLRVSNVDALILRMRRVRTMDASGANALRTLKDTLERRGVKLLLSGLQLQPTALLERMGLLGEITAERRHLFETTDAAIEHAWSHVVRNRKPSNPAREL